MSKVSKVSKIFKIFKQKNENCSLRVFPKHYILKQDNYTKIFESKYSLLCYIERRL